jgi:hypothetical protein
MTELNVTEQAQRAGAWCEPVLPVMWSTPELFN